MKKPYATERPFALFVLLFVLILFFIAACSNPTEAALPTLAATAVVDSSTNVDDNSLKGGSSAATSIPATNSPVPQPSSTPAPVAASSSATETAVPENTATALPPTVTPTSLPQLVPTLSVTGIGTLRDGVPTPATPIPSPVPTYEVPNDTTNVLLLGSDTPLGSNDTRTDTMLIVSINREGPTASIISLPRDLYVYLPGRTMSRLNTAVTLGGVELLKQTILYNFGIPIHYYARIDFAGFQDVIDTMGGVEINVSCELADWRLISPDLDPEDEDNWEIFTLAPGIYTMDGDTALWYARSRLSTSDFDRGRRQQQLLRAMLNQGVDIGLVTEVPALWNVYKDTVETDIDIGRLLQFATLAPEIRENGIQNLFLAGKTQPWTVPTSGAEVQLPVWEGENKMAETFQRLFLPPALNQATRAPIFVEIVNATGNPDLAILAADNLATHGFVPVIAEDAPETAAFTEMRYFKPNFRGSYDWLISWIFNMRRGDIQLVEDDSFEYHYQIILGENYDPCRPELFAPQAFLEQ